jgi:hypothetical protein
VLDAAPDLLLDHAAAMQAPIEAQARTIAAVPRLDWGNTRPINGQR